MTLFYVILSLISITSQADEQPGYLKDFNYQVTEVKSLGHAQALENSLTTKTRGTSICANRAHYWAYELAKFSNIQTGKVFIHFTALGEANENKDWSYHVAPYVIVKGEEMVLDPAFAVFGKRPVKMENWMNHFGKNKNCVVLDPANNPAHLTLELNNLGSDDRTPLSANTGPARQYPSTEGICYVRKVPMYYQWPSEVYGADLFRAGNVQYAQFNYGDFNLQGVLQACHQAVQWSVQAKNSCSNYLGIEKERSAWLEKLIGE